MSEALAARLAGRFGRRHCLLTGRAATAITVALRAAQLPPDAEVILPAISCASPGYSVVLAGRTPRFCDVRTADYTLDPGALEAVLEAHPEAAALIPIHLYGHPAAMDELLEIARRRGLFVLEDAAQAVGGTLGGRPLGSFGDASVVSFGHTKIIDVGVGGAVLTDDDALAARVREAIAELPPRPADLAARAAEYRALYYAIWPLARSNPRLYALFDGFPALFREMYAYRFEPAWSGAIERGLDQLDEAVAARRANAARFRALLEHPSIAHPAPDPGAVPWRYSFLIRRPAADVRAVTEAVRSRGIDISNWYPLLANWFPSGRQQGVQAFPNARRVEEQVINLWVEPSASGDVDAVAGAILEALDSLPDPPETV